MSATEIRSLNGYKLNDETARSNVEKLKTESQQYTDTKISQLINSAPTTLDTLGEIADAMAENAAVVEALDAAIGQKANKSDIPSLDGLATEEYVDDAIAGIEIPQFASDEEILEVVFEEGIASGIQTETGALLSSDENTILTNTSFQAIEDLPLATELTDSDSLIAWDGEKTVRVSPGLVAHLPETNQPYKQLITDGKGNPVWGDALAYEDVILTGVFDTNITPESFVKLNDTTWTIDVVGNIVDMIDGMSYVIKYNDKLVSQNKAVIEGSTLAFSITDVNNTIINGSVKISSPGIYIIEILSDSDVAPVLTGTFEVYIVDPYIKPIDQKFLPEGNIAVKVTSDNNGQFLRVVNGEWAAVSLPYAEEASF